MLAEQTQALPITGVSVHWMEAAGIILAMALSKVWDSRIAHPKVKKERNNELDAGLGPIRDAIGYAQQSNNMEFGKLNTRFDRVEGTVDVVADDVKGLKDRELERLETDAREARKARRR